MKKNLLSKLKLNNLVKSLSTLALIVMGNTTNSVFAQNWNEVIKVVASDRAIADQFGYSVSISGDYAIVGANQEDHNATGGQFLDNAGAAYILRNISGTWTVVQKIVASDRDEDDEFGTSVAISGDYAIVGAPRKSTTIGFTVHPFAGAAYIFQNTSGTWSQVNKVQASDREGSDEFGHSVAISGDYAIVGAPFEDHSVTGTNYQSNKGSAYVYKKGATIWTDEQKIVSTSAGTNDYFGWSVGISGDYAIIGMPKEGLPGPSGILTEAGSAVIYYKNTLGNWTQMQNIIASDEGAGDEFGHSVAISGDFAIAGAYMEDHNATGGASMINAGSAYIFERNGGTWTQMDKIVASDREVDDKFGVSVSISGDYAIVGAYNEDHDQAGGNYIYNSGSAYIFKNTSGIWAQANKIVSSDRAYEDLFGNSVAISGDYAIAGAYLEDENATGGNSLYQAGSIYVFQNTTSVDIKENSFENEITISPNPSNGNFSIDLGAVFGNAVVSITDVSGKLIESKSYTNSQLLNLSLDKPAGIYFIAVHSDSKKVVLRCVKQ